MHCAIYWSTNRDQARLTANVGNAQHRFLNVSDTKNARQQRAAAQIAPDTFEETGHRLVKWTVGQGQAAVQYTYVKPSCNRYANGEMQ